MNHNALSPFAPSCTILRHRLSRTAWSSAKSTSCREERLPGAVAISAILLSGLSLFAGLRTFIPAANTGVVRRASLTVGSPRPDRSIDASPLQWTQIPTWAAVAFWEPLSLLALCAARAACQRARMVSSRMLLGAVRYLGHRSLEQGLRDEFQSLPGSLRGVSAGVSK